jgi:uroporphyrinogen III methyltransferase/synthase
VNARPGTVYLVGAGPGDPGLLTRRGEALLRSCQALVYDRLGTEQLLDLAPPEAVKVYVGKQPGKNAATQDEIHEALLEQVRAGRSVVRLKGGDPFVFGRGSEEALVLRQAGIPFEVVPGVTSGIAAPAYAGIPVTHRAMAVGVTFFTGHEDPTKGESQLNLDSLARPGTTGVFYMGRRNLPRITERLLELGRSPDTPVAMVEWGTYPRQRTVTATLGTAAEVAEAEGVKPPVITVVGEVVGLREEIAWFEDRPLAGRCVAVTRAREQASRLAGRLRSLGARVLEAPTIQIADPEDAGPLKEAAAGVGGFDWLVLASPNACHRFFQALGEAGGDARRLAGVRVAVAGRATAQALEARGIRADVVPHPAGAKGLLAALEGQLEAGSRVLVPRSAIGREELLEGLRAAGAEVEAVDAYRTVRAEVAPEIRRAFEAGEVDAVAFASASSVENFHAELAGVGAGGYKVAVIGPTTASRAEELGYPPDLVAEEATLDGLVAALVEGLAEPCATAS